jgi:hypothetical protein
MMSYTVNASGWRKMRSEEKRLNAKNKIHENIAEFGFHTYVVTGGGYPHFGYTIGLTESLGAELILAGTYFYRLDDVSKLIARVKRELSRPVAWESVRASTEPWGTFSFRKVDATWARALMLGAFDFYRDKNIDAYQIVPDVAHWTIDVPDLSQAWDPSNAPGWRWLKEEWTYPVPKDSVALTNLNALRGERITEVMRWEDDEWEIFVGSGSDTPESERRVIPLGVLLEADESLLPAIDLRVGTGLWRDDDSDWHPWGNSGEAAEA